jgi:Cu(I)-responsive transcriptional regulator
MPHVTIGEAAAAAGVTPKMIRHYESLGLVAGADRSEAGYRLYSEREIGIFRFIRQARAVGFSSTQIESLLRLWRDEQRASRSVKQLAARQLAELEERRRELDEMHATLSAMVHKCRGDEDPHCAILEHLAAPKPEASRPRAAAPKNLKQVAPGTKRAAPRQPAQREVRAAVAKPHEALSAWTRGLSGGR